MKKISNKVINTGCAIDLTAKLIDNLNTMLKITIKVDKLEQKFK